MAGYWVRARRWMASRTAVSCTSRRTRPPEPVVAGTAHAVRRHSRSIVSKLSAPRRSSLDDLVDAAPPPAMAARRAPRYAARLAEKIQVDLLLADLALHRRSATVPRQAHPALYPTSGSCPRASCSRRPTGRSPSAPASGTGHATVQPLAVGPDLPATVDTARPSTRGRLPRASALREMSMLLHPVPFSTRTVRIFLSCHFWGRYSGLSGISALPPVP